MPSIWTNNSDANTLKAFRSLTNLRLPDWDWTDNAETADLWCLDLSRKEDVMQLTVRYRACGQALPKVIFLSHEFAAAPVPDWVYFRSPVNLGVLVAWLQANGLDTGAGAQSGDAATSESERWKKHAFRLKIWPNTTEYSDSPNIVFACGAMLRSWHTLETASQLDIEENVLHRLLTDAEKAGNMEFKQDSTGNAQQAATTHEQTDQNKKSKTTGMWGKLKGLIGIS